MRSSDGEMMTLSAGEEIELKVRGLFYGIGHQPNSHLFKDDIDLDDAGYIKVISMTASCASQVYLCITIIVINVIIQDGQCALKSASAVHLILLLSNHLAEMLEWLWEVVVINYPKFCLDHNDRHWWRVRTHSWNLRMYVELIPFFQLMHSWPTRHFFIVSMLDLLDLWLLSIYNAAEKKP